MVDGKRRMTLTVDTPEEAAALLEELRERDPAAGVFTLGAAMDLLRSKLVDGNRSPGTERFYEGTFRVLLERWDRATPLARIGPAELKAWVKLRREQDEAGPATIRKNLGVIQRLFRVAMREFSTTGIRRDPVAEVDKPQARPKPTRHLTLDEIRGAIERIRAWEGDPRAAWDADVVEVLALTGLRRAELARVRVEDVDVFRGRLFVRGKCGDRELAIPTEFKGLLGRLVAAAGEDEHLVPGADLIAKTDAVGRVFGKWRGRLGVKLAPHVLRVSFATWQVDHGMPALELQAVMGHATFSMTSRYYRAKTSAAKAGLAAMGRALGGNEPRTASQPAEQSG